MPAQEEMREGETIATKKDMNRTHLGEIARSPAVPYKTRPHLPNEDIPHLGLVRAALCIGFLIQVEHPLREGHKVADKVAQRRPVRDCEEREEVRVRFATWGAGNV
jgi:hypothetical protein